MLPITAQCVFCNLDGWRQQPITSPQAKSQISQEMGPSTLMECSVCYEIAHPDCAQKACDDTTQVKGVVNEDLPNSWECPLCCISGKNTDYKVSQSHFQIIIHDSNQTIINTLFLPIFRSICSHVISVHDKNHPKCEQHRTATQMHLRPSIQPANQNQTKMKKSSRTVLS